MLFVVVTAEAVGEEPVVLVDTVGPFDGKDIADAEREAWDTCCEDRDKWPTPIAWLIGEGWRVIPLEVDLNDQIPKAT